MNKIEMVKGAVGLVVSVGVGKIVGNIINATSNNNASGLTKICITAGGFVLGCMAGKAASDYCETKIDGFINEIKEVAAKQA